MSKRLKPDQGAQNQSFDARFGYYSCPVFFSPDSGPMGPHSFWISTPPPLSQYQTNGSSYHSSSVMSHSSIPKTPPCFYDSNFLEARQSSIPSTGVPPESIPKPLSDLNPSTREACISAVELITGIPHNGNDFDESNALPSVDDLVKRHYLANPSKKSRRSQPNQAKVCGMCHTVDNADWRRGANGEHVCNACGLRLAKEKRRLSALSSKEKKRSVTDVSAPQRVQKRVRN